MYAEKELDSAAKVNLENDYHFQEYQYYKQRLKNERLTWEETEPILVGFIWGILEMYDEDAEQSLAADLTSAGENYS